MYGLPVTDRRWRAAALIFGAITNLIALGASIELRKVVPPNDLMTRMRYLESHGTGVSLAWVAWIVAVGGLMVSWMAVAGYLLDAGRAVAPTVPRRPLLVYTALASAVLGGALDVLAEMIQLTVIPGFVNNYLHVKAGRGSVTLALQSWSHLALSLAPGVANVFYAITVLLLVIAAVDVFTVPIQFIGVLLAADLAGVAVTVFADPALMVPTLAVQVVLYCGWAIGLTLGILHDHGLAGGATQRLAP